MVLFNSCIWNLLSIVSKIWFKLNKLLLIWVNNSPVQVLSKACHLSSCPYLKTSSIIWRIFSFFYWLKFEFHYWNNLAFSIWFEISCIFILVIKTSLGFKKILWYLSLLFSILNFIWSEALFLVVSSLLF